MATTRYLEIPLDESKGPIEVDGRHVVSYPDFDGISMLCDRVALLDRYRDHVLGVDPFDKNNPSVGLNATKTLTGLANACDAVSWGTHQSPGGCVAVLSIGPFDAGEIEGNAMREKLDVGYIDVRGPVFFAGWHLFTYGADYRRGDIGAPGIEIPHGYYRVTVHRQFTASDDGGPSERALFLVQLDGSPRDAVSSLTTVPGADGWF